MDNPSHEDIDDVKGMIQKYGPAAAAAKIKAYLEEKKNTPLNIAITGESGSGKSTFVNAFRGLDKKDKSAAAAPTGCTETTMEVKPYPHPNFPNVTLWDLPGIGTTNFPADKYLEHVCFQKFDFFIIISADRFREHDVKLAKGIQNLEKKFYFVRSKIDHSMRDEEETQSEFNAEKTLSKIRNDCVQGLEKEGFQSPQVFLVSSRHFHLYDFNELTKTLKTELPAHKRDALLLAMNNGNLEIIKEKKAVLQSEINSVAWLSALTAAVPVLSFLVNITLLVDTANKYKNTFGLDSMSLQNLAESARVPLYELRSVMKSRLALEEISKDQIIDMLQRTRPQVVGKELLRCIPIVGTIAAATLSFTSTKKALNDFLDMLAEDAERVFQKALNPSV